MINFGPVTVTYNGTNIGKTAGGGSVNLITTTRQLVGTTYNEDYTIIGAKVNLNMFSWSTITLASSLQLYTFGEVILESTKIKITLYSAKILVDPAIGNFGKNAQNPFKLLLIARANGSGNVIKMED